jgi:hypothetical protein
MSIKPEKMWAIHGTYGFYVGTWLTRREAIQEHTLSLDKTWNACRKKGDRCVRVVITAIK